MYKGNHTGHWSVTMRSQVFRHTRTKMQHHFLLHTTPTHTYKQITFICSNSPHELLAVRAEGGLLEEGGHELVLLHLMDFGLAHAALALEGIGGELLLLVRH